MRSDWIIAFLLILFTGSVIGFVELDKIKPTIHLGPSSIELPGREPGGP